MTVITEADVRRAAVTVAKRYPTRENPLGDGLACVYKAAVDGEWRHCLGGEILLELGESLPTINVSVSQWFTYPGRAGRFDDGGLELLQRLQSAADGGGHYHVHPDYPNRDEVKTMPWLDAVQRVVTVGN